MAGQRGLDGVFGRFQVADFADEDNVRVVAEDAPQRVANVSPILACTWIWLMPSNWYSTGSSVVMIFVSSSLISNSEL